MYHVYMRTSFMFNADADCMTTVRLMSFKRRTMVVQLFTSDLYLYSKGKAK